MFAFQPPARQRKTKFRKSAPPVSRSTRAASSPRPCPVARPLVTRPGFMKLLDRLERGDVLVVTKMDRLGRDAIDVATTVEKLAALGVSVHCLALGGVDLTSPAGRMTMSVIVAVAQFERDLLIERTQSGLSARQSRRQDVGSARRSGAGAAGDGTGGTGSRREHLRRRQAPWHEPSDDHAGASGSLTATDRDHTWPCSRTHASTSSRSRP